MDSPVAPGALSHAFIEYMASPTFWTEKMKAEFAQIILPSAEAWYRGQ